MGFGIGGGLAEGLQEGDANFRANQANDRANVGLQAQLEAEHAQTQATTDADARAQALAPGEVKEQSARIGLMGDQDAAEKQATAQGAQSFTLEQKQRNGAIAMQQMQLTHDQFATLHENALATAKMLNAGLSKPDGTVDTKEIESTWNEGVPVGHRMVPGTLKVTRAANPMDSTITYTGDDGKPHSSTLQQWNTYATAFLPPTRTEVVGSDQRLVDSQTGQTITPATGPGIGKVNPTSWDNGAARQVMQNNGGLLDENGNPKFLDSNQAPLVGKLTAITQSIGKQTGYNTYAYGTVASAVQDVYAGGKGLSPDDPKFIPTVISKLQGASSGYGVNPAAPSAPASQPPQAPTDPSARTTGTVYQTPKGPMKWMGSGWQPQT